MGSWRRPAMAIGAVGASSALSVGGCIAWSQEQKRQFGRREDVIRAVTCDASAHRSSSSSVTFSGAVKKLQLPRDQVYAAARHLYPIEKLIEQWIHCERDGTALPLSKEEVQENCEKWSRASEKAARLRAKFGKRISHNAQGVDIGSPVEPYFETTSVDEECRQKVADALQRYGACYVKNALPPAVLSKIRENVCLRPNARHVPARETGKRIVEEDPNVTTNRYTTNRLHCLLRGTLFEQRLESLHPHFLPFVYDFFPECLPPGHERLTMSEMQLVITEPMAYWQSYHADNGHKGLTVLIPLERTDIQANQLILPGTHRSFREALDVLVESEGAITHPGDAWEAGDAWILDSRTLHRGRANRSAYESIPMLIIRYDLTSTMPPGQHVWEALWLKRKGRMLERLFHLGRTNDL